METLSKEEYCELRDRETGVMYAHCANCLSDPPEGLPPAVWSDLEVVMDMEKGVLTVGCARCKLPIISAVWR
jgi:hypothetical protein